MREWPIFARSFEFQTFSGFAIHQFTQFADHMNSEDRWRVYLDSLAETSRATYSKRVGEYVEWCQEDQEPPLDRFHADSIRLYLESLRNTEAFAASTLWTIYSMISSYYESHHNHKVHTDLPMIQNLLKQWAKVDEVKKAKAFTKDEIIDFLQNGPNDDFFSVRKVAVTLAISGLLRRSELIQIE